MESDDSSRYTRLELFPFKRQVSGCHMVLEINKHLLCKPYFDDEGHFYDNVTKDLKDFIPTCYGTVNVTSTQCEDKIQFHTDIPLTVLEACCNGKEIDSMTPIPNDTSSQQVDEKRRWDPSTVPVTWSRRRMEKFVRKWKENPTQKFLILENLLEKYEHPCILDVKLGQTKRGIYESETQKLKKEGKSNASTASTTSFSIGGLQVFSSEKECYIHHGKEYCRALKVGDLLEEFQFFFTERGTIRRDVIFEIIQKLEKLYNVLSHQERFYFYSSSLLIIYDNFFENDEIMDIKKKHKESESDIFQNGSLSLPSERKYVQTATPPGKADVRLIDFTHSVDKQNVSDKFEGNSTEILEAICYIIKHLYQIFNS